jgi:hypothetical protein
LSLQKPLRKEQNYGDGAGAAAPNPASSPSPKRGEYGKTILSEDECLSQALNFMRKVAVHARIHFYLWLFW